MLRVAAISFPYARMTENIQRDIQIYKESSHVDITNSLNGETELSGIIPCVSRTCIYVLKIKYYSLERKYDIFLM